MDIASRLSTPARSSRPGVIDELFDLARAAPDIVSLAAGAPDTSLLPVELLGELTASAVDRFGREVLQYGATQGFLPLREALVPRLRDRGVHCGSEDVHVSTGGSGALNNVCLALLDPGDVVAVERPTYAPAVKVFRAYQAKVIEVACDADGMLPDALDETLRARPVKFVYLMPTFQNPTGRSMPPERRAAIASVARHADVLLVEDDVYSELRYAGTPAAALTAFAPERSVYLTSCSKLFAPAMRVGVAVMPKDLLARVLMLKQGIDMQTSTYTQALVTEFLTGGHAEAHLVRLHDAYAARLRALDSALTTHLPLGFSWQRPDGGMFLWLTGPASLDAEAILPTAIARGVAYVPGSAFHVYPGEGRETMRLSFAGVTEESIEEGVRRLAAVVTT
ncbi:PLP-dependent aminotransferase family protein [Saccharopolyspora sp. ASAGF58]|uniref:aminotransferase-like domain-containing protein n=1 Tax=Saccharopolyspora sp. ASAGF58 TaxID=2719023 RepID=UPI00143FCE94|nr:PLP-dependent aminotransferase family protein [Saccharopolyspora sp. ASAGF58]QIZ37318.1 PLP-dependent aminotransferase family protein [Saccharopolyspora sp. ASAGF58]